MANEQSGIRFFVILTLLCLSAKPSVADSSDEGEGSPLLDVMQQLLQESSKEKSSGSGLEAVGGLVQMFMQAGGGKQLGDLLASGNGRKFQSNTMNIISGLGSLLNSAKSGKESGRSGGEQGGFDPSILGSMVDIFSAMNQNQGEDNTIDDEPMEKIGKKNKKGGQVDWGSTIGLVGNLLSSMGAGNGENGKEGGGSGFESLLTFLPVLMSSLGGKHQPHSSGSVPHHTHEPFLPPFLENLHEYWDHFKSSQFGRTLWENSGLASLAAQFTDKKGNFIAERVFESLENNTQRRRWVKGIASFVSEWAKHIADDATQKRYMNTVQILTNSFLQSEGYAKDSRLDMAKPGESISAVIDEVFSRQFSMPIESGKYIKPAISYFQEIFSTTKSRGILSGLTSSSLESRLVDTLDGELIEPVLRANRAYRYALRRKSCARYVLCVITNGDPNDSQATMKPAVVKLSSIAAAWFLSTPAKLSFWDLYGATSSNNCNKYNHDCSEFHEEDTKATTEYFHNEL